MNLASNLINGTNSSIIPNVAPKPNSIYNPDIPVKSDSNNNSIREQRQIKLKDRYYIDNLLTDQVKNNGTMSLGDTTSRYTRFGDIDRSIDVNTLRRRNVENTKYTMPDDYFNGSHSAYYSVPRTVRTPVNRNTTMGQPIAPLPGMNMLNYKNQFSSASKPIPIPTQTQTQTMTDDDFEKWLYEDDEEIPDDLDAKDDLGNDGLTEYDLDKMQLDLQKNKYDKSRSSGKDKYGKPIIRSGAKVRMPHRNKDGILVDGSV